MRLLVSQKSAHKSASYFPHHNVLLREQTLTMNAAQSSAIHFLKNWALLLLLFTFLFSFSNLMVHWITPYLPQIASSEASTTLNRTQSRLDSKTATTRYAACLAWQIEMTQNLDEVLPLIQTFLQQPSGDATDLPLCVIPNKTQTVI